MNHQYPHSSPSPVIVLGAGVVGLTTGVEVLKLGFPVLLIAQHLPGDPQDPLYASQAAGAHHLSFAADSDWRQRYLDLKTFERLWEESENEGEGKKRGLMRLTQTEYYKGDTHLRLLEQLPNFRVNSVDSLPYGIDHSVSFESITIEPARYLPHLMNLFTSLGGVVCRIPRLNSLAQASSYARCPMAVVNCTGMGASQLTDVRDVSVHPVRGQVVVIDAAWIKTGWTRQIGSLAGGEGGERTYIIPRASGEVIVGGTREVDDLETSPRPETTADILRRALEICPTLAYPPHSTSPVPLSSLIKSVVVGYRPTRDSGIRLEAETLVADSQEPIKIVHNYGHGGYGWQCAWGCAEEAARIVREVTSPASRAKL